MTISEYFDRTYRTQCFADRNYFGLDHWETLFHVLNSGYALKHGHY